MQHYTTIEQSKKLVELGLNPETADMCYIQHFRGFSDEVSGIEEIPLVASADAIDLPCWSVGALLEVMPEINNQLPSLRKCKNYYCVVYSDTSTRLGDNQWQNGKTSVEAAYNMVVWLIENGYIKKGE